MSQQINLYQPIFRKQKKKFSAEAMLQGFLIVLAGALALVGYAYWQNSQLRAQLSHSDRQLASATKRFEEAARKFAGQSRQVSPEQKVAELQRAIQLRERVRGLLSRGIFANTQGFSGYFAAFGRQHVPGVWLTSMQITGAADELMLSGRSQMPELVPRYLQRLSQEKPLAGIEFQSFQLSRPKEHNRYVEFTVRTGTSPAVKTP
jgi:hypothetical protein